MKCLYEFFSNKIAYIESVRKVTVGEGVVLVQDEGSFELLFKDN